MRDSERKANALRELASALTEAQRCEAESIWREAQTTCYTIEHDFGKERALYELAEALIQAQRWEQAQELIYAVRNNRKNEHLLRQLAVALTQAQQWAGKKLTIDEERVNHELSPLYLRYGEAARGRAFAAIPD